MSNVEEIALKIGKLSLSKLCQLVSMSLESNMEREKIEILLRYLEASILKYRLGNKSNPNNQTHEEGE